MMRFKKSGFLPLLAVVVLLQLAQFGQAQNIYVLPVVGGENEPGDGYIAAARGGIDQIKNVFRSNVPKENLIFFGPNGWGSEGEISLTGQKLLNAIDICPAGSNDTIVIYWIGHGGGDRISEDHSLTMAKGKPLVRSNMVSNVLEKRVRLSVIITDTCAESVGGAPCMEPKMPKEEVAKITNLFDELFIKASGLVDLSSASRGQYSWSYVFTPTLVGYLADPARMETAMSWSTVVAELRDKTDACFKNAQRRITPEYLAQLKQDNHTKYKTALQMLGQKHQTVWVVTPPLPGETTITTTHSCCQRCGFLKRLIQRGRARRAARRARRAARRCCCECCCN